MRCSRTRLPPRKGCPMKALTWQGKRDVQVEEVPDPRIQQPTDAIIRITSTAICGSDLHLYEVLGAVPEARATSSATSRWASSRRSAPRSPTSSPGDRVVVPFNISCGRCWMCSARPVRPVRDDPGARAGQGRRAVRLHLAVRLGARRAGRVPPGAAGPLRADQGARRRPDERFLFLSDILPTAWQAVRYADVPTGGTAGRPRAGPGRPVRRPDRPAPRRRPGDRRRPRCPSGSSWPHGTASRRSTSATSTTSPAR